MRNSQESPLGWIYTPRVDEQVVPVDRNWTTIEGET